MIVICALSAVAQSHGQSVRVGQVGSGYIRLGPTSIIVLFAPPLFSPTSPPPSPP